MIQIAIVVTTMVVILVTMEWRRWRHTYDFYISEMMFMTSDSYRLPLRDKVKAAISALKVNNDI